MNVNPGERERKRKESKSIKAKIGNEVRETEGEKNPPQGEMLNVRPELFYIRN